MSDGRDREPERPVSTPPSGQRVWQTDMLTDLFQDPLDGGYTDAARARRERGPLPSATRWTRRGFTVVVCAVIGVLLAVAYLQVIARAPARATTRTELIKDINRRTADTDKLDQQAETLQDEVNGLREQALDDTAIGRLRELEAATGLRKVSGDGVVVTLADGPNAATERLARILDLDLQLVTNALWASGAEAISVNGRRLTSVTPIRTAGSAILIGNAHIIGPYQVAAIGPSDMADRFNDTGTADTYRKLRDDKNLELGFDVDEKNDLELPAAVMPRLQFAHVPQPSPAGTPTPSTSPSGGGK
ncbi:DUF881 domain-containing protein [Catellatospora citrea]|uniref:Membrane protein n=1 Tax=Catellatospora citrea TaxID=53366 RepID=A0A8J3P5Q9_9ACTN|nr:DUF881 domain-containing protein [Catellatospora citrea]RKE06413.1 uncharacterized protein YlxW (UPF0749 family) [Catellatospora citrea]GIG02606.1 membrane protein [Catellatospora citrea]